MSTRMHVTAVSVASLLASTIPSSVNASQLALPMSIARFSGVAVIYKGAPGRATQVALSSTSCTILNFRPPAVPTLLPCAFGGLTGAASLSTTCSGVFEKFVSTLSYVEPTSGESVNVSYETTLTVVEGEGTGVGVNRLKLGHAYFTVASLCAVSSPQTVSSAGQLDGYATGT